MKSLPNSKWAVRFSVDGRKAVDALDGAVRKRIENYLRDRVIGSGDPRGVGKALRFGMAGLWRYRVGDYRIVCKIEDAALLVLVIDAAHRRHVYDD